MYGDPQEWVVCNQLYPGDLSGKTVRVTCRVMSPSSNSAVSYHPGWFQDCSFILKIQEPVGSTPIKQVVGIKDERVGGVRDKWLCITNEIASFPGGKENFKIVCLSSLSNGIVFLDDVRMEVISTASTTTLLRAVDNSIDYTSRIETPENTLRVSNIDEKEEREIASFLKRTHMQRRKEYDGSVIELQRIDEKGMPEFVTTDNRISAIVTTADKVRETSPYNVAGSGWHVGIWDAGSVMSNHAEYAGRINIMNNYSVHYHPTYIAGTICAKGIEPDAKGMASQAVIDSYDWNSDIAEMVSRGAPAPDQPFRLYLSNHSYGRISGWYRQSISDYYWYHDISYSQAPTFGQYDSVAEAWDTAAYYAPYYLVFKSAGNDRTDPAPGPGSTFNYLSTGGWVSAVYNPAIHALGDGVYKNGFDTLSTYSTAKNILTVGAVSNAVTADVRDLFKAGMTTFSCWGPTDDGRVKPDVVGDGIDLYTTDIYGLGYWCYNGTSASTPNICGSALLLMNYYSMMHPGSNMLSSTLKGLVIHTADDLGNSGPDYVYGWGLMNTERGAETIRLDALDSSADIQENSITTSETAHTFTYYHAGPAPLKATICWTDPPGYATTQHDNRTPQLVNDLDVRILAASGQTNYPYVLDYTQPDAPATTGDNTRDNVEQVFIRSAPAGTYTVSISYKGSLYNGEQQYSLIVSDAIPEPGMCILVISVWGFLMRHLVCKDVILVA